ncbi:MAG: glycine--tRNA ligase, partial [Candidatus Limnocylindria bacterium]
MEAIVSLAKRRGFVFPSSEIYGGMGGFWDYGPLGVELKNNVKQAWWRSMVQLRDDIVGLDAAIVMNPRVWEVSGHVAGFSDPMVDCRSCKLRFRAEDLKGPPAETACPNCGSRGTLTD